MRHKRAGLHLSRTAAHRKSLFSNMVAALLTHERIRTTLVKAKEVRRLTERVITLARRLGDILKKAPEKRSPEERARVLHAVRMARRMVRSRDAVLRLFDEIAPRMATRHGGYTRIIKTQPRPGDAAPMAILEMVPSDGEPGEKPAPKKAAAKESKSKESKSEKPKAKKATEKKPASAKKPATAKKKAE